MRRPVGTCLSAGGASCSLLLLLLTPRVYAQEAPAEASSADADEPQETAPVVVDVRGQREGDRQRRSANAVTVVDLTRAKTESADVGEVLSRTEGINVQRSGALGSAARFRLAGFDDQQVRFFMDGIPLEYSGYSFGLENVPIGFAERIDVYKGVVPVRFGADALGGAFDVVTDRTTRGTKRALSFQGGQFGTYRSSASVRHLDAESGLFSKAEAFYDRADNDYVIDIEASDSQGRLVPARAHRTHDAYEAFGANLEAGFVRQPWAQRLLLRAFVTDYSKELQHNVTMTAPYGAVTYSGLSTGGNVRYEQSFGQGLSGSFVTGYVFEQSDFLDVSTCRYDWFGRCHFEGRPGEVTVGRPSDRSLWDHTGYARWNLTWRVRPEHWLRYAISPTVFTRTGEEREQLSAASFDPLHAKRDLFKWINGLEYEANFFDALVQNVVFGKAYLQVGTSEEPLSGGVLVERNTQRLFFGGGDALRVQVLDWLLAKASYEYAIRLPEPVELFGDGVQIVDNLLLEPERSHNLNLSLLLEDLATPAGVLRGSVTGFHRGANNLIRLLGRDELFRYENVYEARTLGVEAAAVWTAPGEHAELAFNTTYQEVRNLSKEGTFRQFEGDRLPNEPYLLANAHLRLQRRSLVSPTDVLALTWYSRYVHEFFLLWESVGQREQKHTVDAELLHTVVLSYQVGAPGTRELSFSAEVQNVTDETAFDYYGVQRPGRALFAKTTAVF